MALIDDIKAAAGGDETALAKLSGLETSAASSAELGDRLVAMTKKADDAVSRRQLGAADQDELDGLRTKAEKAEEDRLVAAGDFKTASAKHREELQTAKDVATAAGQKLDSTLLEAEVSGCSDLFGANGSTVLTPEIAWSHYKHLLSFQNPEANGRPRRAVVRDRAGELILGKDGEPATVAAGLAQLIETDPQSRSILRASGTSGSGSDGQSSQLDVNTASRADIVKAAQGGDKVALNILRETQPSSQVDGRHWENQAAG